MVETRLRLTGIGEGLTVQLTTALRGADSPGKIRRALLNIFPDVIVEEDSAEPTFGHGMNLDWEFNGVSLAQFLTMLHEQRILDTALDAMSVNLQEMSTCFHISRQAALAGKISFPIPGEHPLGGVFTLHLHGTGLGDWLQAATWHSGRSQVPRAVGDGLAMEKDGEASTWF